MIKQSEVKRQYHIFGYRVTKTAMLTLNSLLHEAVVDSIKIAKGERRKTVCLLDVEQVIQRYKGGKKC
jgi:histone H3/H4